MTSVLPGNECGTWGDDDQALVEDRVEVGVDVDDRILTVEVHQGHERLVEHVGAESETFFYVILENIYLECYAVMLWMLNERTISFLYLAFYSSHCIM